MKKTFILLSTALALVMAGCTEKPYIDAPGNNDHNTDSIPSVADPIPTPDPEGVNVPAGAITVNEAVKIGKKLASGEVTDKEYYIKGWVNSFNEDQRAKTDFARYGNDFAYLSARQDGQGTKLFYCYRIMGPSGAKLPDYESIVIGDFIVVKCKITNYNGIYENNGNCWTVASSNAHFNDVFADALIPADTIYATCEEAKTAALALKDNNVASKDIYIIEGFVQSEGYSSSVSRDQQIFWIADTEKGGKVFEAYYCNVPNGEAVPVGAKVRMTGNIMRYNSTPEMKNGDVEIISLPNQE